MREERKMKKGNITIEKEEEGNNYYLAREDSLFYDTLLLTPKELKDIHYLIGKILEKCEKK